MTYNHYLKRLKQEKTPWVKVKKQPGLKKAKDLMDSHEIINSLKLVFEPVYHTCRPLRSRRYLKLMLNANVSSSRK